MQRMIIEKVKFFSLKIFFNFFQTFSFGFWQKEVDKENPKEADSSEHPVKERKISVREMSISWL